MTRAVQQKGPRAKSEMFLGIYDQSSWFQPRWLLPTKAINSQAAIIPGVAQLYDVGKCAAIDKFLLVEFESCCFVGKLIYHVRRAL